MSDVKRIAFVCPRFAEGPTVGGAETLLKNLAVRAASAGLEVTFLTTCATNHFTWANELPAGPRTIDNINVIFFPVNEDRDVPAFLRAQEIISRSGVFTDNDEDVWLRNNVNSTSLCDHLREHGGQYDRIVMGPYLFGLIYFAAMIQPAKTILVPCLHDEPFAYLKSFRKMFRTVHGFMFNTVPERDLACRLYGLEPGNLSVVGMGLMPFDADQTAFAGKHGLSAPYVIYSGRREPLKGTPLLIDYITAFRGRTERDVKLVFTGSGQIDIPSELSPHVIDLGFVSEEEKRDAMAGAVAFCHPSVNESLGIVILEAWLAQTPALVHGKSEVLRYQCKSSNGGLWFHTYPEFEEELILLLDNDGICSELGRSGREYVLREYSWKAVEPKMLEALAR